MRRILCFLLLCGTAFAQGGLTISPRVTVSKGVSGVPAQTHAATTLDASCAGHGTVTPTSCSGAMTVAGGDVLVATIAQFSFGTVGCYVADNLNGPWNAVYQGLFNSDTGHWVSGWVLANSYSGQVTPTVTCSGSTSGLDIVAAAFKGASQTTPPFGPVDPSTISFNPLTGVGVTSTNPCSVFNASACSANFAPANPKEVIYCGMGNLAVTPTAGTNFTLLSSASQTITLWPEYWIQTTATATNGAYTAASDTWFDGCFGVMNAASPTGGVLPFSGFVIDGHGNANNTTLTAGNALSASYNSINQTYSVLNVTTAKWVTGGPCPARVSTIYVNGNAVPGTTGVSLQHTGTLTTEDLKIQMWVNPSGFGEEFYCISQSGFAPAAGGGYCDISSLASTPSGDDSTPQMDYIWPTLTAAATASGGNTVYTAAANTLTLTSVATNTTGANNNGQAVYTGTITAGGSNAFMNKQFLVTGFTNTVNNGTYVAIASTTTTLTLMNANAIAETHAATATTGNLGDGTGQGIQAGNNWLAGASVTIAGFTTGANNGTFTVVSSTPSTVTVNNASGVSETHSGTMNVGYSFRQEITNTTTTLESPGVLLPNGTSPYLVDLLTNFTNGGVHTMKIFNATTGALIGTDTIPVTGLATGDGSGNTLIANFMGQGSCGMTSAVFQYSNMGGSSNGVGYPWPE